MQFTKEMTGENCGMLAARILLVDKDGLYKGCTPEEARESYAHKLELVDRSVLRSTYLSSDDSKAVLFPTPVGTITSNAIVMTITRYLYEKLVLDPATGKIISAYVPGMGKSVAEGLMKMDFKSLSKCK